MYWKSMEGQLTDHMGGGGKLLAMKSLKCWSLQARYLLPWSLSSFSSAGSNCCALHLRMRLQAWMSPGMEAHHTSTKMDHKTWTSPPSPRVVKWLLMALEQQQQAWIGWGLPLLGLSMIQFNSIFVSLSGGSQNTTQGLKLHLEQQKMEFFFFSSSRLNPKNLRQNLLHGRSTLKLVYLKLAPNSSVLPACSQIVGQTKSFHFCKSSKLIWELLRSRDQTSWYSNLAAKNIYT